MKAKKQNNKNLLYYWSLLLLFLVGCSSEAPPFSLDGGYNTGNGISTIICRLQDEEGNTVALVKSDSAKEHAGLVDLSTRPDSTLALLTRHKANDIIWFTVEFFHPDGRQWSSERVGYGRNLKTGVFLSNGNYMIAGIGRGIVLVCLDETGQLLWEKTIESGMGELTQATTTADSGVLVSGSITTDVMPYSEGALAKFDYQGNLIWEKSYIKNNCALINSVIVLDDGRFAALGTQYFDGLYLLLDNTGDPISSTVFFGGDDYIQPKSIKSLPGGDMIIAGSIHSEETWDINNLWMSRIKETGEVVWDHKRQTLFWSNSYASLNIIGQSIAVCGSDGKSGLIIELFSFIDMYDFEGAKIQNQAIHGLYLLGGQVDDNLTWYAWVHFT